MTTKPPRNEAISIVLQEIKSAIPTFLICNAIILVICMIYGFTTAHDWRFYTGLAVGNTAMLLNFYALGVKAGNIARMKEARRARIYALTNFFLRYIGAFVFFGIMIYFRLMSPVTAAIPLFFPKLHYSIMAIRNKT
jgi:hypothetical protein